MSFNKPTYMILIDNLRYDQWKIIEPYLLDNFTIEEDTLYTSILPTSTQYSRNAIFAGLPSEIQKKYPNMWKNDEDDGGKNLYEESLLKENLKELEKLISNSVTIKSPILMLVEKLLIKYQISNITL